MEYPSPEQQIFWRRARLFPNGDLIASYTTAIDSPYGYGLVRLDKDSGVIWKYPDHTHHDFYVSEDSTTYTLVSDFGPGPKQQVPQFPEKVLEEYVVKLSPAGNEVKRISIMEAILNSQYSKLLQMYRRATGNPSSGGELAWDPIHANTIELIEADFAEHHAFASPGDALLSFRGSDAVALLDMEKETIVWATRGFWSGQHHPTPLPNGHLLLFDNQGYGGTSGGSRIVEYAPKSHRIVWSYTGSEKQPFWSKKRGSLQVLPNDNILVTSSRPGRIFELTPKSEIVWDFYNPARKTIDGTEYTPQITSGLRYHADELEFLDN